MSETTWNDLGSIENFNKTPLQEVQIGKKKFAISCKDGIFGAISGVCNHVGGPLGNGRLDGDYVVCPWHNWKFHREKGIGEPGFENDAVPSYELKIENGHLFINLNELTPRKNKPHPLHSLERPLKREEGPIRIAGISTTAMDSKNPRYSTSEALLLIALEHASSELNCQTRLIKLNNLQFRNCEGYYSKSASACTWPCSITQMDPKDEMTEVYEALVHWADVVVLATPIRWGAPSSLYFKMVERLNCVQNQITISDKVLIRNKVISFIITGGQDNIQAVAGQVLTFFSELGFHFPQFPYIAHSRGWSAEDMESNVAYVMGSEELRAGAKKLIERSIEMSKILLELNKVVDKTPRGGRKAHSLSASV